MTCRNHGSCSWCEGNRLYGSRRAAREADQEIREYLANPHEWEDEDEWEEDYWFEDYMPYDDVIDIDDWRWSLEDDEW